MTAGPLNKREEYEAQHIIESEKARGHSEKDAEHIGYATVNKNKHKGQKKSNGGKKNG
jgi:hypothetical protein